MVRVAGARCWSSQAPGRDHGPVDTLEAFGWGLVHFLPPFALGRFVGRG